MTERVYPKTVVEMVVACKRKAAGEDIDVCPTTEWALDVSLRVLAADPMLARIAQVVS